MERSRVILPQLKGRLSGERTMFHSSTYVRLDILVFVLSIGPSGWSVCVLLCLCRIGLAIKVDQMCTESDLKDGRQAQITPTPSSRAVQKATAAWSSNILLAYESIRKRS